MKKTTRFTALALAGATVVLFATTSMAGPPGTLKVWETLPFVGADPTELTVDKLGITGMVDTPLAPLTNITAWENAGSIMFPHSPCAIIYWNPVTNDFCWFGWTGGTDRAIAVAPASAGTEMSPAGGGFPARTYGPGDVWNVVEGSETALHFAGTGNGVCKGTDPTDVAEIRIYSNLNAFAVAIEPQIAPGGYDVWVSTTVGSIRRLNPATGTITNWPIPGGGAVKNIALDSMNRPYVTVDRASDALLRLIVDPITDVGTFTTWSTLTGIAPSGFVSAGVTVGADDIVSWAETSTGAIGNLDPVTNQICRIAGGSDTRLVESSGSRTGTTNNFQIYFTEGSSSKISIITDVELTPGCEACSIVTPTIDVVTPTTFAATFSESTFKMSLLNIPPVEFTLTPTDCAPASGALMCTTAETIAGVSRYPTAATGHTVPAGMSEIADLAGVPVVFGTFEGTDSVWEFETCALIGTPDPPDPPGSTGSPASPADPPDPGSTASTPLSGFSRGLSAGRSAAPLVGLGSRGLR